jgi:uncharacterized tellurite resistance protein B-like protein
VSLSRLLERFRDGFSSPAGAQPRHDPMRLATAAILLEIAHADGDFSPTEDGGIAGYLTRSFALGADEARELMAAADEIRRNTIDYFALTNFIRQHAPLDQRIEIVKTMWRIVYSDGRLTDLENYLVRKLAGLLGIEHRVMIDAKVAVIGERGE